MSHTNKWKPNRLIELQNPETGARLPIAYTGSFESVIELAKDYCKRLGDVWAWAVYNLPFEDKTVRIGVAKSLNSPGY